MNDRIPPRITVLGCCAGLIIGWLLGLAVTLAFLRMYQ